jgi:hypothetical protein
MPRPTLRAHRVNGMTAQGDSFEFVNFSPPPGWVLQNVEGGRVYARANGVGTVTLTASRPDFRSAPEVFAAVWRTEVQPAVGAPPPEPQLLRQDDFAMAVGGGHVTTQDKTLFVSLMAVAGFGRSLDIFGMAADAEALRELVAFFDTVTFVAPGAPAPSASDLVGRWWKDAGGDRYFWLEFSDKGAYSYETPLQSQAGTYRVDGNRITMTPATGAASTRFFSFECVGGTVRLEFRDGQTGLADGYWSNPPRWCRSG